MGKESEAFKVLEKNVDRLDRWNRSQQDSIAEQKIATAVAENELANQKEYVEKQFDLLRESIKALAESIDAAKTEFSHAILKIVFWVVATLMALSGLGLGVWKIFLSST